MKNIAVEIFALLRSGVVINTKFRKSESFCKFLKLFVLLEIVRMIISVTIYYIIHPLNLEIHRKPFQDLIIEKGLTYVIIIGCFLAPLLEEVGCRLCLKYSSSNLTLMIGSWFFFVLGYIVKTDGNFTENGLFIFKIITSLLLCSILFLCLKKYEKFDSLIRNFWLTYPKIILYTLVLWFAFSHILNYRWSPATLLLTPLLTLPQMLGGITLSYARLKYGVIHSIFLHSMSNLIGILIISNSFR